MGLNPDFALSVGGKDVTARFRDRLLTMTVTDNSGEEADQVEIILDDRDYAIESPRKGATLNVSLGWVETGVTYLGAFVVDEVEAEGPPDQLTVRGKAADMRSSLKAAKTRAWRDTTLGDIVGRIAREHGLEPAIGSELAGRAIAHRDQTNESDLHFLTRLGRDFGAVAAPKDGKLVFAPSSSGLSASGRDLPEVTLDRADLSKWRSTAPDREAAGKVRARWRDRAGARTRFAEAGSGEPVRTLRHLHADQATAQAAAEAELARAKRAESGVELELDGRPEIVAQTPVTTTGLRPDMNGRWIAQTVEHQLDYATGGFTTKVTGAKA